jgi:hypothetical protein
MDIPEVVAANGRLVAEILNHALRPENVTSKVTM